MVIRIKLVFVLLLTLPVKGQSNDINNSENKTIHINFNRSLYTKIAVDSLKKLYDEQREYYRDKPESFEKSKAIAINYKFNDLSCYSIPTFRLRRSGYQQYDCDKNIEDFIEFEENLKYQIVLIQANGRFLTTISVPNLMFELERIFNPDYGITVDKDMLVSYYINSLSEFPEIFTEARQAINDRKENFFFTILGLNNVLFEVDKNSNLLYALWTGPGMTIERMPANDYLRQYEGATKIKDLARGYYADLDELGTLDMKPCEEPVASTKKVYIHVHETN